MAVLSTTEEPDSAVMGGLGRGKELMHSGLAFSPNILPECTYLSMTFETAERQRNTTTNPKAVIFGECI